MKLQATIVCACLVSALTLGTVVGITLAAEPPNWQFSSSITYESGHFGTGTRTETVYIPFTLKRDRKSTRLNSSHVRISYAVFCLKKNTHQLLLESRCILRDLGYHQPRRGMFCAPRVPRAARRRACRA